MRRLKELLRDKRGEMYIDMLLSTAVIMSLIACLVAIAPIFTRKMTVDYMASTITKTIESTGQMGAEYYTEVARLEAETGIKADIDVNGTFDGNGRIQLREPFTVNVRYVMPIKLIQPAFANALTIPVTIQKSMKGYGEVFWKPES